MPEQTPAEQALDLAVYRCTPAAPEPSPLLDLIEEIMEHHDGHAIAYYRGTAYPIRFGPPQPLDTLTAVARVLDAHQDLTDRSAFNGCSCGSTEGNEHVARALAARGLLLADAPHTED